MLLMKIEKKTQPKYKMVAMELYQIFHELI